jgi:hypothetical protein
MIDLAIFENHENVTVTERVTLPAVITVTGSSGDLFAEPIRTEYELVGVWHAGSASVLKFRRPGAVAYYDCSTGTFLPEKPAHAGRFSVFNRTGPEPAIEPEPEREENKQYPIDGYGTA